MKYIVLWRFRRTGKDRVKSTYAAKAVNEYLAEWDDCGIGVSRLKEGKTAIPIEKVRKKLL